MDIGFGEHPLFGGWAVALTFAMMGAMSCGSSGKNELGKGKGIATMIAVLNFAQLCSCLVVFGLVSGAASGLSAAEDTVNYSARPVLRNLVLGGRSLTPMLDPQGEANGETAYQGLSLWPGELPLEINLATALGGRAPVVRLRSRLEGFQTEWEDHESQMWLVLRFLDPENRAVSSAAFIRTGESPGWGGLPQNSRWYRRVDEAVVPERCVRVQILLVSGGTPKTTGFWAVRHLRLTIPVTTTATTDATTTAPLFFQLEALRGAGLDSPLGNPDGWGRDGTGLSTPRIFSHRNDDGGIEPVLALVDVDPANTGGWLQGVRTATPVAPGQRLRVESEEMHSIGRGGDATATFRALPVGNYVFRAWASDELGRPTGPSLRLPVEVRPPFYGTTWFRLLGVGVIGAGLLGGMRYFSWRKLQREVQRLEQRRAVEEERTRMARDLHDEMGARFTQISLLAGRALKAAPADGAVQEPLRHINGAVKELAAALEEIVWAANPSHDSLEGFSNYLSQYAGAVLRDAGVRCRLDIPTLLPTRTLPSGLRHRLMMVVKEALNNALKHARASEVRVQLELDGERLRVTVADNGSGFDPAAVKRGNGLDHSMRRMEEVGGTCVVDSMPGAGTHVRLHVPLPATEGRS
ncbi:MAG: sensor histidine kinase [Opitutus sp.]|nr:sensor histidine kinase [Opitutus sp.]